MNGMATYAVIEDDAEIRCDVNQDGEIEVYLGSFAGEHGFFEGVTLALEADTLRRVVAAMTASLDEFQAQSGRRGIPEV